ncbi:hypothetical protein [Pseudomonas hunanensis]|uniref:hypothetical protein n=1 Tax=Pseudomonas hunanensis TaxID=1247546 RepID=UPI0037FA7308
MSFGNFFSKAASLVGKAVVAIASEAVTQGPYIVNREYLNKVSKARLDSRQMREVERAKDLNSKVSSIKSEIDRMSGDIKDLKGKIKRIQKDRLDKAIGLLSLIKVVEPEFQGVEEAKSIEQKEELIFGYLGDKEALGAEQEEISKFLQLRDEYSLFNAGAEKEFSELVEAIDKITPLVDERKNECRELFKDLRQAMSNVKSFGDQKIREMNLR